VRPDYEADLNAKTEDKMEATEDEDEEKEDETAKKADEEGDDDE